MITPSKTKGKGQLPALDPNKTRLGASGGLAIVSGIVGGVAKGAFNLVKNVLSRSSKVKTANPVGMNVKTYLESHGKLISSSKGLPKPGGKPVNYKGPNPVSKIGAGGNSY